MNFKRLFILHYYKLTIGNFYYKNLAPYHNVLKCAGNPDETLLGEWVAGIGPFEHVTVLAGGPTASKVYTSEQVLYVPTNSSINLVKNLWHVYFLAEGYWVYRYLKSGLSDRKLLAVIFREETRSGSQAVKTVAQKILAYKSMYKRNHPEIFATDLVSEGAHRQNYEELEKFTREALGLKFKQFNSGFGALQVGFYIAARLQIPLHIYGLDAGLTGNAHFDGTPLQSNAVSGDKVHNRLDELLRAMYAQSRIPVRNYSAFLPKET